MVLNLALIRQLFAFGCVGLLATAVHYSVALFAKEGVGLAIYFANLLGYACAVLVSLYGHGRLTYRVPVTRRVARRFVLVSLSTLGLSELLLLVLERYFYFSHRISLLVVVLSIPLLTFLVNKFWVYRQIE